MTIPPGATSQSIDIQIVDDTGVEVTGLVAATLPALSYSKGNNVAAASISLSDLALITTAWTSGGVKERANGVYRLDLPDAVVSTAAKVTLIGGSTNKRLIAAPIDVQYVQSDLRQAIGVTQSLDANNVLNVSMKYIGGTLQTARDLGTSVLLSSGTGTGQVLLTSGKTTPIDVDGITHASAMEILLAVLAGVANPNGSTLTFMKRDGTTAKIAITHGNTAGKRTASTIQS